MGFEIPRPSMTFHVALDDGARIRMRRHGIGDGVRLLLANGNGFDADAYFPYWQYFLASFDLLVFDFRNHGHNGPRLCRRITLMRSSRAISNESSKR